MGACSLRQGAHRDLFRVCSREIEFANRRCRPSRRSPRVRRAPSLHSFRIPLNSDAFRERARLVSGLWTSAGVWESHVTRESRLKKARSAQSDAGDRDILPLDLKDSAGKLEGLLERDSQESLSLSLSLSRRACVSSLFSKMMTKCPLT